MGYCVCGMDVLGVNDVKSNIIIFIRNIFNYLDFFLYNISSKECLVCVYRNIF